MKSRFKTALALAALLALSACGGGDDDAPPVTSQVPPSASASVAGFMAYLVALVATAPDDLEPVDINAVTAPTTETAEPDVVS